MLAHTYGEWSIETASTCIQKGIKKRACTVCAQEESTEVELSAHTYGEWTTTTAATCGAAGEKTRSCSVCGNEETGTIEKKSHSVNKTTGKCENCGAQIASPQIKLTTSNIYDYLSFNVNSEGVVVTEQFGSLKKGD
jgi:hypothetical protein